MPGGDGVTTRTSGGAGKTPPQFVSDMKTYAQWLIEIELWSTVTEIKKEQQGSVIALSLPDYDALHNINIRERVMNDIDKTALKSENGVQTLIAFLDPIYKQDDLASAYEKWLSYERFTRKEQMSMEEYVSEYQKLYNRIAKLGIALPSTVQGFKLLDSSGLDDRDRKLVLTGVDYSKPDTLFTQMSKSLKKYFGKEDFGFKPSISIKTEPSSSENDVLYTGSRGFRGRGRGFRGRSNNRNRGHFTFRGRGKYQQNAKNKLDQNGEPIRCFICGSWNHLSNNCPDQEHTETFEVAENENSEDEECGVVLFTQENGFFEVFTTDSINCAVLDSACSSTVCGKRWLSEFMKNLSELEKSKVKRSIGVRRFKFGSGCVLKSIANVTLPCKIGDINCKIRTDVVESNIPLLLGKPSMKKAGVSIDFRTDSVTAFDQSLQLLKSKSGHYVIPIYPTQDVEAFTVSEMKQNADNKYVKLHTQFGHPSPKRLFDILRNSGDNTKNLMKILENVTNLCKACISHKRFARFLSA